MIYDYSTRNKSFVIMSQRLGDMGVNNNKFMLELHNEKLQNFDYEKFIHIGKRDPISLSREDTSFYALSLVAIRKEIEENPWYFFREMPFFEDTMFHLNITNLTMIWGYINGVSLFVESPRQTTKTTTGELIQIYDKYFSKAKSVGDFYPINLIYRVLNDCTRSSIKIRFFLERLCDIEPSLSLECPTKYVYPDGMNIFVQKNKDKYNNSSYIMADAEFTNDLLQTLIIDSMNKHNTTIYESVMNKCIDKATQIYIDYHLPKFDLLMFDNFDKEEYLKGNKKDIYLARFASNMFPDIDFDDLKETLSFDKKAVNSEIFLVR